VINNHSPFWWVKQTSGSSKATKELVA